MITVRHNTFETNSSSQHVVTIGTKLRPKEEFLVPDEKGRIIINLDVVGGMLDFYNDGVCSKDSPFQTFKDYLLLAMVYTMGNTKLTAVTWTPGKNEQKKLVRWVNTIYSMVGLPKVTSIILRWNGFLEVNDDGCGDCSGYHDQSDTLDYLQSGTGLDEFFESIGREIGSDTKLPQMEQFIEGWDDEDYKNNIAFYNSALAMVYDTTSEIYEDH